MKKTIYADLRLFPDPPGGWTWAIRGKAMSYGLYVPWSNVVHDLNIRFPLTRR